MKSLIMALVGLLLAIPVFAGVNALSGNLSTQKSLFSATGGPMPLGVMLKYNSLDQIDGEVGVGWNHSYDLHLHENSDGTLVLTGGVRKRFYFPDGNGNYIPRVGDYSTLVKNPDSSYTLTFTSGRVYQFDTNRQIISITNRHGNSLSFDRTVADQVTVTDPANRSTTIHFNGDGRVDWIRDPANNQYDLAYNGNGQLQTLTYPEPRAGQVRPVWTFDYDANGLLEYITDPNQQIRKFAYQNGKVSRIVAPEGVVDTGGNETPDAADHTKAYAYGTSLSWARDLRFHTAASLTQSTLTEKDGGVWIYGYAPTDGTLLAKQDPQGNITEYSTYPDTSPYHGLEKHVQTPLSSEVSGSQRLETYRLKFTSSYDGNGNPLTVEYRTRSWTVNSDGSISNLVDEPVDGQVSYTYGTFNRPTSITDQIRTTVTTISYTDLGSGREQVVYEAPRINSSDPEGPRTTMIYRSDGQVESITDPLGRTLSYSYDTQGKLTDVLDPNGLKSTLGNFDPFGKAQLSTLTAKDTTTTRSTSLQYDALSRLFQITEGPAANQRITQYDYDGIGNRTSVIDAEGNVTDFEHSSSGQVEKITQTLNPGQPGQQVLETILGYGGAGCGGCSASGDKLTSVMDARQNTLGSNLKTIFTYDNLGRMIKETDPEGNRTGYVYTAGGQLKEIYQGEPGTGTLLLQYDYDLQGKLLFKKNSSGTALSSYSYDTQHRLQTAGTPDSSYTFTYYDNGWLKTVDNGTYVIEYQYDALGRREYLTLKQGATSLKTIDYVYHPTTRELQDIVSSSAGTFSFSTDLFGRRHTLTYPNGVVGTYNFDDASQTDWLSSIAYTDGANNLLTLGYPQHDKVGNRTQRTEDGTATAYTYDALYRVTQAKKGDEEENFGWDEVGNRTTGPTVKETAGTYSHNAVNQMLQGRKQSYTYDQRGNQEYRYLNVAKTKYWQLTWTPDNKLQQAQLVKDSQTIRVLQFKYDPFGRRIEKTLTQSSGSLTTSYLYDGEDILLQIDNDGTSSTTTLYTHGPGIDEPLARTQNSISHYYHADGLGSIVALTDGSKTLIQRYTYDTFGNPKVHNPDLVQPYLYTSREWDRELGLYYYRARYYDPMEGRFISKDPIGFAGGDSNIYAYVGGDPVNWIDSYGLAIGDPPPRFPPGHNPDTWRADGDGGFVDPENNRWRPHNEDEGHWRHWDKQYPNGRRERVPKKSLKPWPNQKKKPYGDQSPVDPNPPEEEAEELCKDGSNCQKAVTVVKIGGASYIIYRCVRFLPSLAPPLWPTAPANLAIP